MSLLQNTRVYSPYSVREETQFYCICLLAVLRWEQLLFTLWVPGNNEKCGTCSEHILFSYSQGKLHNKCATPPPPPPPQSLFSAQSLFSGLHLGHTGCCNCPRGKTPTSTVVWSCPYCKCNGPWGKTPTSTVVWSCPYCKCNGLWGKTLTSTVVWSCPYCKCNGPWGKTPTSTVVWSCPYCKCNGPWGKTLTSTALDSYSPT